MTDSGFCSYTNPSRATIPLIRPHQCDSEGGRIRGVLLYTYEEARTQVMTSIGVAGKNTVRVGLHQGSSLSPYLFDMVLDVMGRGIKEQPLVYVVCRRHSVVQH